ncbi:PD-(D/E)XK nuclease-like domain-containing protein [Rhodococcus ruber]|uniref:PD-(D/E)XK nuclease-like domain-containing protein n=1 Tax=Rhodococcus ruber TaxID=1830 RepID=UPI0019315552|nr:PD-(D/E)XK nuclease-like domain-containing protein [Rhodococcus ruber]
MTATLTIVEPGLYDGLPSDTYHADPVPAGSLSSTGARKLLAPSCPALFKYERDHPQPPKKTFDFGHAAHQLVLGEGPELREIPGTLLATNGAVSTKDAKAFVAEARADGAVPLKPDDYQIVHDMAAELRAHPVAGRLFRPGAGKAEQSGFWQDEKTGIWRRVRFDWIVNPRDGRRLIIADYKTARSAEPSEFARAAIDHGYHQQHAWYLDAARALRLGTDPQFVFVVQEKTPPYVVSVIQLDETFRRIGDYLNRQALDIYEQCTRTDVWPGYADDVALTPPPVWYERSFEEEIAA